MFRRLAGLLLPVLLLTTAGCDETTAPGPTAHVGTYSLVSVNGLAIPAFVGFQDGLEIVVENGTLILNADGTATDEYEFRYTDAEGTVTPDVTEDTGTYVRNTNIVTVTWASGFVDTFRFSGSELSLQEIGFAAVFRKD